MEDSTSLRDLERTEGENALLPGDLRVQPYMYEPRRPTITIASQDSESEDSSEAESDDEATPDRLGNTDWCECGECVPMPSIEESRCCREVGVINNLVEELDLSCVTEHPGYTGNCLNRYVIETSFYEYLDHYGHVGDDEPIHELYRYVAYRRFTRWVWHRLGRGVRKPIPSCAMTKIREAWPSEVYTGFRYARDY